MLRFVFCAIGAVAPMPSVVSTSSAQALPPGCSASSRAGCKYLPDINTPVGRPIDLTLIDPARSNYPVLIRIRYPLALSGRRPVIIWNHGGGPDRNGRNVSSEWSEAFASAGYIVIHPSRTPIADPAPFRQQCRNNGVPGATAVQFDANCAGWVAQFLYGPRNVDFLIQNVAEIERLAPSLAGRMDATRVMVGGWSAGTAIAFANAGARRQLQPGGPIYNQTNTRPLGFMGVSPTGADYADFASGFQSTSFDSVDSRPFLFVSGKNDGDAATPTEARSAGFLRAARGGKYFAWTTSLVPTHSTMNISDCGAVGTLKNAHCEWIRSLGLAFADSLLRRRPAASSWIASDAFVTMTDNVMELHRR